MLVKTSFVVICWVAMAGLGYGQPKKSNSKSKSETRKSTSSQELSNTLLWEISGNGMKKPSYLFGTMHILCAEDAQLSERLKDIIKNSDVIYFELDMDDMQEMMGALQYLRMNDGQKISELLTKEEYAKVETYFKDNNFPMPLSLMNRFKPYFVSSLIGEQMLTCQQKNGMEMQIMNESKKYKKDIKGLESTKFQASIFDSIPYDKQAKDLVSYIDSIDNYKKVMLEMVDVYRQQDLVRMDSLMHKSDPGMEEYMDILLYDRNKRWVEDIPNIISGKSVLFAVGAGHLPGEEGVINLLRKAGYKVSPLPNNPAAVSQ
jgi:uncharacterized protein YbaP (TraB family)